MVFSSVCGRQRRLNALLVAGFLGIVPASAHDPAQHAEMSDDMIKWFYDLRSEGGAWCCSYNDGIADPDWQSNGGRYEVWIKGAWRKVDPKALITDPNKYNRAWVWITEVDGVVTVKCFLPGAGT